MFASLVLCRLLRGAGTWIFEHGSTQTSFIQKHMSFVRGAVRGRPVPTLEREPSLLLVALPNRLASLEAIACARVRTLAKIADKGAPYLQAVVAQTSLWAQEVRDDACHVARIVGDQLSTLATVCVSR